MEWLPVVGFEGLYEVSDEGQVRSVERKRVGAHVCAFGTIRPRILKHWDARGYPSVSLRKDGKTYKSTVHLLVARAFLGLRPADMETCHNDGTRNNPRLSNLRYDTQSGNNMDKLAHGTDNRGERHPLARLTNDIVRAVRADGRTQRQIAAQYGIRQQDVSRIKSRQRWAHVE